VDVSRFALKKAPPANRDRNQRKKGGTSPKTKKKGGKNEKEPLFELSWHGNRLIKDQESEKAKGGGTE